MVTQYPHILKFNQVTGNVPYKDENGDTIVPSGTSVTIEIECRFEPNLFGNVITSNEGKQLLYAWTIYMPLGQQVIPNGVQFTGFKDLIQMAAGIILRYEEGQMNARAWV